VVRRARIPKVGNRISCGRLRRGHAAAADGAAHPV